MGSEDLDGSALRNFEASFLKEEERVCSDLPAK
jgi:hypothetical protein